MTPTAPERHPSAVVRAWRAFRRWRRGRPFWGGLWTVLSGLIIFLSTQLDLGNVQIRMGEEGFQSLVIPAVLVVAGLLLWFSPAQRVFYGVIAAIVALASLVLVNLGGFFLGALFGMVGGALGFAWTPRYPVVDPDAIPDEEPGPEDPLGYPADEREPVARAGGLDVFFPEQAGRHRVSGLVEPTVPVDDAPVDDAPVDACAPVEDSAPADGSIPVDDSVPVDDSAPEPESYAGDEPPGEPDEASAGPGESPAGSGEPPTRPSYGGPLADTLPTGTVSPLATPPAVPGQFAASLSPDTGVPAADTAGGAPAADDEPAAAPGEPPDAPADTAGDERPATGRGVPPAGLVVLLVVLSVVVSGLAVVRFPVAASAAPCPPRATPATTPTARAATPGGTGPAPVASPTASAADVGEAVGGALGSLVPGASGTTTTATPSPTSTAGPLAASPDPAATTGPSAGASEPTAPAGTSEPTATAPPVGPSGTPASPSTGSPAPRPAGTPSPASAPAAGACDRQPAGAAPARTLAAAAGQPLVNEQPSRMTAASLTMSGLSYDGVVDLPTRTGTVRTLRFSMDRTVSTPFDLRVSQGGRTIDLRSDRLTVTGAVTFYTSRFEAKLGGLVPVTFTPDSPPLAILPDVAFTDASIDLVYITGGTLTASNLDISLP